MEMKTNALAYRNPATFADGGGGGGNDGDGGVHIYIYIYIYGIMRTGDWQPTTFAAGQSNRIQKTISSYPILFLVPFSIVKNMKKKQKLWASDEWTFCSFLVVVGWRRHHHTYYSEIGLDAFYFGICFYYLFFLSFYFLLSIGEMRWPTRVEGTRIDAIVKWIVYNRVSIGRQWPCRAGIRFQCENNESGHPVEISQLKKKRRDGRLQ